MRFFERIIRPFGALFRRICRDQRGNVLLLIGLATPILVTITGFATDYAYASYLKRTLDKSIDAAVIASTSQTAAASGAGYGDLSWLQSYGVAVFQGNARKLGLNITPTLTVVPNASGGVVSSGSYSYAMPTYFSSIFGLPTIVVSGQASATANPTTYINYYIMVDISQSMGVAATQADMTALYNRTVANGNAGCVFGCHVAQGGDKYSNEYLAHNISPRINLRIDAAISAIQTIINDAKNASGQARNIKIGIYTVSADPTTGQKITKISDPTADYATLTTLVGNITLGNNNSGGTGDTDFPNELSAFNSYIPTNGSGALAASPKNYVFIITDAAGDVPGSCYTGHCMSVFSPDNCTSLKAKATVGTIYTTYLPIYNKNDQTQGYEAAYAALIDPIVSQFAPNMQSCATNASYYYQATDGPALNAAMQKLFASTLNTARLTQ
ncbi:hypothetical protein FHS31_001760 [Sphingomonas vulcanisoli]|uniref:Flp pilus-assembly TadG-like N-terminal domain-containing protein n=1 Tax=Sphingomonas vulcanisoli TaxID=1658060 RepID=A0ABX0TUK3_9SPHN|nr:pilus assembly protein TadG-related protein [Sphingomonas vulcanisoli]NIJ08150.1 hypothetical protein [Sphingomonas vulcanisoli]